MSWQQPCRHAMLDSQKIEHGKRMMYAVFPSFLDLGLEDRDVPTLWLLLWAE